MSKRIGADIRNSDIVYCIDEYVRLKVHREILKAHWFDGVTLEGLAGEYHLSLTAIKKIVYDIGDVVIARAARMSDTKSIDLQCSCNVVAM